MNTKFYVHRFTGFNSGHTLWNLTSVMPFFITESHTHAHQLRKCQLYIFGLEPIDDNAGKGSVLISLLVQDASLILISSSIVLIIYKYHLIDFPILTHIWSIAKICPLLQPDFCRKFTLFHINFILISQKLIVLIFKVSYMVWSMILCKLH